MALNGAGRIFHSPPSPLFSLLALLFRLFSTERLSLHCSPKWKIMDLINWSLNAIDTIFSTRSLGSGEPACPDGTFAAGYTMDAWERWRIVCLAALSVEDIDIYLFGTMITGFLLIGLGFALGYRRIQKTGTVVQSLTKLPVMIEAVGRAVSIETETINRNMDSIMEKLTALQRKIDGGDQNGQREQLWNWNAVTRPKTKQPQSYLFWLPWTSTGLGQGCCWKINPGRALQWDALAFLPHSTDTCWLQTITHTHIYKDMHSPPHPRSLASVALNHQPDKRVCVQRREWLQDRMAACWSWITSPVA